MTERISSLDFASKNEVDRVVKSAETITSKTSQLEHSVLAMDSQMKILQVRVMGEKS